jgi:flagellin FlaB
LVTIYVSVVADGDTSYTTIDGVTTNSNQKDSNLDLAPRTTVTIVMTPEAGATTMAEFVTPSSYGTRETIQLYP